MCNSSDPYGLFVCYSPNHRTCAGFPTRLPLCLDCDGDPSGGSGGSPEPAGGGAGGSAAPGGVPAACKAEARQFLIAVGLHSVGIGALDYAKSARQYFQVVGRGLGATEAELAAAGAYFFKNAMFAGAATAVDLGDRSGVDWGLSRAGDVIYQLAKVIPGIGLGFDLAELLYGCGIVGQ